MALQYGNGIVQGKAQGYREKGKEKLDVIHKVVEAAALNALIGKPIADEENDRTQHEET
jgi:hypothetical protein